MYNLDYQFMQKKITVWQIEGHRREKILLGFSFILIYPMFRISHYQRMVNNAIETMRLLRNNLLKIVRYRQNSIAVLHIKYHKLIPKILEELSRSVIEYHINSYNFNDLELEIESILQLINSDVNFDHQIASQYNKILAWTEEEYNNVVQAYYYHYSKIIAKTKRFPWKYLIKINDLKKFELVH
ncbi:MAG: hypothetical protein LBP70_02835 [Mycoplasmataceae bacterium]|nr:hypothetical protein [Mycoplasmataceae bacterium]